jgi:hypothetical protein
MVQDLPNRNRVSTLKRPCDLVVKEHLPWRCNREVYL